jgi:hypothetical protein
MEQELHLKLTRDRPDLGLRAGDIATFDRTRQPEPGNVVAIEGDRVLRFKPGMTGVLGTTEGFYRSGR